MTEEELLYLIENPVRIHEGKFVPTMTYNEKGELEQFVVIIDSVSENV